MVRANAKGYPGFDTYKSSLTKFQAAFFTRKEVSQLCFCRTPSPLHTHMNTHTCPFHTLYPGCFLCSVCEALETCFMTYDTNALKPEQSTHPHPDPSRIRNKRVRVRCKNIHESIQPIRCMQEL